MYDWTSDGDIVDYFEIIGSFRYDAWNWQSNLQHFLSMFLIEC